MDEPRFRVVLTGGLLPGFTREQVMASLAREFETSAANLLDVFEGGEHPIEDMFGAQEASALQQRFERVGAAAKVERVLVADSGAGAQAAGLHLPSHDDPVDAGLMHCPACGHAQLVAKSCDECGVMFADFNRERKADPFGSVAATGSPAPARPLPKKRQPPPHARQNIHADASAGWRDDWLDEGDDIPTEQYHLNLFMGMRSQKLVETCARMLLGRRTRFKLTWAGGAMISPFLWAMHRKMWAWGLVIFLVEILLPVVLITLGAKDGVSDKVALLGMALIVANRIFWPAILKSLYCRHARLTIAHMHRMTPTYASDIDIATRGGTSKTSVFVGVVLAIVVSLLAWSIVDSLYARVMASRAVFAPVELPSDLPLETKRADPVATAQDELLANENRWVSTRNKLRVLGQRISVWVADRRGSIDPAALDITIIARALSLESEAILDGWGNEISFDSDGKAYRLTSAGPDGEFGGSDDVEYRRILEP